MKNISIINKFFRWIKRINDERLTIMLLPHAGGSATHFQINYLHFAYFLFLIMLYIVLSVFSLRQKGNIDQQESTLRNIHAKDQEIIRQYKNLFGKIGGQVFQIQKETQKIYLTNGQIAKRNLSEFNAVFGQDSITWVDSVQQLFENQRMGIDAIGRRLYGSTNIIETARRFYKNGPHFDPDRITLTPVDGYLVRGYDPSTPHYGLDLAAPKYTPIVAAASGRVVRANWYGGYGLMVELIHRNGMRTYYAHNTKVNVKYGDWVEKGDEIAYMGTTGNSTGFHLHFEVRINNQPVDPYPYIGFFIKPTKVNPDFWRKQNPLFGIGNY